MKVPGFLKKKRTYVFLIIIGLVGYGIWSHYANKNKATYETFTVARTSLEQTVDVTGEIKPVARINLSFQAPGQVGDIAVKVGQKVKKGDVLASLDAKNIQFAYQSAQAAYAAAQAQLNLALAGAKDQNIQISEATVAQAQANLDKANNDLQNAKVTTANDIANADLAVKTATDTLENQTKILDQAITNAYENAHVAYLNAIGPMQSALRDGDMVVGVDDKVTNVFYQFQLGVTAAGSMDQAKVTYQLAKTAKANADAAVNSLSVSSTHAEIEAAGAVVSNAVTLVQQFMNQVNAVLTGTISGSTLSSTSLASLKATIDADRAAVSGQLTAVLAAKQAGTNAQLTHDQSIASLTDALQTATLNAKNAKTAAETTLSTAGVMVKIQDANLKSAQAQLSLTTAPPRSVDLDPMRAAVAEAQAALSKASSDLADTQIIAPVDGTVSVINPQVDERVGANQTVVTMLSGDTYDIEVLIPEANVASIKTGLTATTTLDAYGDSVPFAGTVESVEPDQTLVQDAVYYKARVSVVTGDREIKPGETANTTILVSSSQSDALVIPARAVSTKSNGDKVVKILNADHTTREVNVELGMKGDEGRVVVSKGLSEGDVIVVSQQ